MKRMKKNLFVSIIYQCIAIVYGFILPRLVLKHFGSEVNGLTQSISQFLSVIGFLDMGVSQVVRSALYKPLEDQDSDQISRIMVSGRRFYRSIAYSLLVYVMILVVGYPILVDKDFGWLFTATLIAIMCIGSFAQYYTGLIQEQLLHASQKSYFIYYIQILFYIINMIVSIWMVSSDCTIHAVKLATAGIFLIKPLFYTWYIRRNYVINWKISYNVEPIKQKWHGVAQHISAVVLESTDNIVLTVFSTLKNVSIYSVYFLLLTNINGFYQSAVMSVQSMVGGVWAKQNHIEIKQLFYKVEICLHTVTVFVFSCTGILIVPFVQVYTNGLTDANYIQPIFASILVVAYGLRCLRTPYNIWILAAGHFKQTQKCHIIAAAINLGISVLAVSRWGLIGIALGTLISMCYHTLWMVRYTTKKLIQCSFRPTLKLWLSDIAAVLLIYVGTSEIHLQSISYQGWFVMALKVALIAAVCIILVTCIFHFKKVRQLMIPIGSRKSK